MVSLKKITEIETLINKVDLENQDKINLIQNIKDILNYKKQKPINYTTEHYEKYQKIYQKKNREKINARDRERRKEKKAKKEQIITSV